MTNLRAVDFYAGVGGWSLGLSMADIEVAQSYEIWETANKAREWNLGGEQKSTDIRKMDMSEVPSVDVVVGSPPCTQFSYANRGGNGDIQDGLVDIRRFLEAVVALRPRYWAMENVPRTAAIIEKEMSEGGLLEEFAWLKPEIRVYDMSEFGVPQRRKRCIAGVMPFDLLDSYKGVLPKVTLRDVVKGLRDGIDPVYGGTVRVTDNVVGMPLSAEEERMNREKKAFHPVYNDMPFPDPYEATARTVTATCTRVSRESIVVADPVDGFLRLLTVRESASLQWFPATYQFPSRSRSERIKMAGNAVPPLFTYLIACAMKGVGASDLALPGRRFEPASRWAKDSSGDKSAGRFPSRRSFRAAIGGLRFKSGTSFELLNRFEDGEPVWQVGFHTASGASPYVPSFEDCLRGGVDAGLMGAAETAMAKAVEGECGRSVQDAWTHSGPGMHPFDVVDAVAEISESLRSHAGLALDHLGILRCVMGKSADSIPPSKMAMYAEQMFFGLVAGAAFNRIMAPE